MLTIMLTRHRQTADRSGTGEKHMAGVKNTGRRAAGWIAAICSAFSGCAAAVGETTGGEIFVSERISHNYTKVSAGYTLPVYTGDDIPAAVDESVTDAGGAGWTDETMG